SAGADIFELKPGEGTDTITDFGVGDQILLSDGLSVGDLTFSGSNILAADTREVLAVLMDVDATTLTASQFV
ncbi:MAG: hypothetical protein AAFP03_18655, partial [Cyanobacteria bacterium J06598_3]